MPILDSISAHIQSLFNAKTMVLQHDLKQYQGEGQESSSHAIGFALSNEEDEEEDDDE